MRRERDSVTPNELRRKFIYDPDTGEIFRRLGDRAWSFRGRRAFAWKSKGYRAGDYAGYTFLAHRVAWAIYTGSWPINQLDHVNGDGGDNRIANLREVTNQENCRNLGRKPRTRGPDSGVIGVYWYRKSQKWMARIKVAGEWVYLGTYVNLEDAARVRKEAEKAYGFHPNHGKRVATDYKSSRGKRVST